MKDIEFSKSSLDSISTVNKLIDKRERIKLLNKKKYLSSEIDFEDDNYNLIFFQERRYNINYEDCYEYQILENIGFLLNV